MTEATMNLFNEACRALGHDPATVLPDFSLYPEKHRKSLTAYAMIVLIIEHLNKGWEPDWNDDNQKKWFTWHWVEADKDRRAGFGFSITDASYDCTNSHVGSRLCFPSSQAARAAEAALEELYIDYKLMT